MNGLFKKIFAWFLVMLPAAMLSLAALLAKNGGSPNLCHLVSLCAVLCVIPCVIGQVMLWPKQFKE